jgi:hypothetical protein
LLHSLFNFITVPFDINFVLFDVNLIIFRQIRCKLYLLMYKTANIKRARRIKQFVNISEKIMNTSGPRFLQRHLGASPHALPYRAPSSRSNPTLPTSFSRARSCGKFHPNYIIPLLNTSIFQIGLHFRSDSISENVSR